MNREVFPRRKLTDNKLKILTAIFRCNKTYKSEIERLTGLDVRTVITTVHELRTRGLVKFEGHNLFITDAGAVVVKQRVLQPEQKIRNYCPEPTSRS